MSNGENGEALGEYGELEDLREYIEEHGDAIEQISILNLGDGDGFVNVRYEGEWHGYDLAGFDAPLWESLFDFIDQYDIDYEVYVEA